ncbi:MAG TPA: lysylphosphatidylglycerol synthase transmembrane domain-containing protein, partial [bacterium]|nr:lysylphosphatidylglycerol synthase transmembrane domain-containing protein [bacterium]
VSYVLGSLSLVVMLRVFHVELRATFLFRVGLLSVVLQNLIALPAGISLRLLLLGGSGVPNSQTLGASFLLAYMKNLAYFTLIPLSLIYVAVTYHLPTGVGGTLAVVGILTVLGIIIATFVVLHRRTRVLVLRGIRRLWLWVTHRDIRGSLMRFEQAVSAGLMHIREYPRVRLPLFGLILGDVAATIATLWFCFAALGIPIHLGVLITGFNFGITLTVISLLPGDLGVQEASMAGIFALFGVPFSQGVLAAILFRVLFYFVPFVVSLAFYWHTLRDAARGKVATA